MPKPIAPNEVWSFDFVSDRIENGGRLKILTIVDDFTKRSPGMLTEFSITSNKMIHFFEELGEKPRRLCCDNGREMTKKISGLGISKQNRDRIYSARKADAECVH